MYAIRSYYDQSGSTINTLNVIEGDLPPRARKLVVEWAENYQTELKTIWETQKFKKLPPLE